jgi:hypothetical protein
MPTRTLKSVSESRDDLVSYDPLYISLLLVPISCVLYLGSHSIVNAKLSYSFVSHASDTTSYRILSRSGGKSLGFLGFTKGMNRDYI